MPAHKHAALIMQYAQDAQETETPWDRWEVKINGYWEDFGRSPNWDFKSEYRRKPETIDINGYKVPKPMRVAPTKGTLYFLVSLLGPDLIEPYYWGDDNHDKKWMALGICHLTEEAARKHAEALLSFTKVRP